MATETGTGMQPLLATQELLHGLAASLALSCTKQKTSPNLDFVTDVITGARVTGLTVCVANDHVVRFKGLVNGHPAEVLAETNFHLIGPRTLLEEAIDDQQERVHVHIPLLGDSTLQGLPAILSKSSDATTVAQDVYNMWLDHAEAYPVIGKMVLEFTCSKDQQLEHPMPDNGLINALLLSLFVAPLLLQHGIECLLHTSVNAGVLPSHMHYQYVMGSGFVETEPEASQQSSDLRSGQTSGDLVGMTPHELAELPWDVLQQAMHHVQHRRGLLDSAQGILAAIIEDQHEDLWQLVEGTDESMGVPPTIGNAVAAGQHGKQHTSASSSTPTAATADATMMHHIGDGGTTGHKRPRPSSAAASACSTEAGLGVRHQRGPDDDDDDDVHDGDDDSHTPHGDRHARGCSPAQPANSSSGDGRSSSRGGADRGGGRSAKHMRHRKSGEDATTKQMLQGQLCMDEDTLQFASAALEHNFVQYRAIVMQTKEPYVFWTAGTVGLAIVLAPQPITSISLWCIKVGVVLRALRMVLYMLPRGVLNKWLGGPARALYSREVLDFLLHVGIALVIIPRYLRESMMTRPLGPHTILTLILLPMYLYCMSTQSFAAMRFVWARWLILGMALAFSTGTCTMSIMHTWPFPLRGRLACVAGCLGLVGGTGVVTVRAVRNAEVALRRQFAGLAVQEAGAD